MWHVTLTHLQLCLPSHHFQMCLTHVWGDLDPPPSYTCHWPITFQGVSHMCEETWSSISLTPIIDMSPSKVAHTCVSIFPPLNGQNPNPCGVHLASTSLILRDPSPPSCIRSQLSISSLISYKRRAPLLIFKEASSTSLLCCWICEQPHPMSNEIINHLMVSWSLHVLLWFH